MPRLRTLLVLARASNLPTVWSNCLAGWWLGGHGNAHKLPFLFAGATLLYIGGMYLNDAFDVDFDRQHRKERPIPSGAISFSAVCKLALLWLALGVGCLFWIGSTTGGLGVALLCCILLYDVVHKVITFSPVLMGACRFFLYLVAASIGTNVVGGWPIWCGLALAVYMLMGLRFFFARREKRAGFYSTVAVDIPRCANCARVLYEHWRIPQKRIVAFPRVCLVDAAMPASCVMVGATANRPHRFGFAGGNCVRGLAGGC